MSTKETKIRMIEEHHVHGKRLGRHVHHDPKSREYDAVELIDRGVKLVTTMHNREVPIFDQNKWEDPQTHQVRALGSCTGNACLGHLGIDPFYANEKGVTFDENTAVDLYSLATQVDGLGGGQFPPNDRGSSTLGVLKAAQQKKWIKSYHWSFDFMTLLQVLVQVGPVIVGVNWYDSFDNPTGSGNVGISPNASIRGGHEFVLFGVDVEKQEIACDNSWGTDWGDQGRFYLSWHDMQRLLAEEGEAGIGVQ